jgi:hypothetical protein
MHSGYTGERSAVHRLVLPIVWSEEGYVVGFKCGYGLE